MIGIKQNKKIKGIELTKEKNFDQRPIHEFVIRL